MSPSSLLGLVLVAIAGLLVGSGMWPMKLMRHYRFEHWWLVAMLTGLVVVPWSVTLVYCPNAFTALGRVPVATIVTANLWSVGWGIANVLCGLCFVRIGIALTGAILTGLGAALGVSLPLMVKGSGLFKDAPDPGSAAGLVVLAGVAVMLIGVVLAALAGSGRERARAANDATTRLFVGGLVMAVIAGVLSCGMGLAFVYGQGPIVSALRAEGAGEVPATFAVWAVGLAGGALVNLVYPVYLVIRHRSGGVFLRHGSEALLAMVIGFNFAAGIILMGSGMRALGALGASVGLGIQQVTQMLGGQALGFLSGEWTDADTRSRRLMYAAIAVLILAAAVMAWGNTLAG
jgi:L-rhamnose-H+ transport protein